MRWSSASKPASRLLAVLVAGCLLSLSLRLAWIAFTTPIELEIREGSIWVHALAKLAGVDIYDGSRVAFVNMNHGPMMSIFVAWLARLFPTMPGYKVIRLFGLAYPVFLFVVAYRICRRDVTAALLAAGALYVYMATLALMLFVGRTDVIVLCAVALCGLLTHELLVTRHRNWSNHAYVAKQVALGAASAVVFLVCWRYAPVVAAFQFVVLAKQLAELRPPEEDNRLGRWLGALATYSGHGLVSCSLFAVGFFAIWLPTFFLELHGDIRLYYRRFFGFFSPQSGWGTFGGAQFELVPSALLQVSEPMLWLCLALVLFGLFRIRRERAQLVAWLLMLPMVWLVVAYGYYKNQQGGGLHYFFEFFAFAWCFIIHSLCRRRQAGNFAQLALCAAIAAMLPWQSVRSGYRTMVDTRERAISFKREVARLTAGQAIYGEETHLFKRQYRDEKIDSGDAAEVLARSGFFGKEFTQTFESYEANLSLNPPKFILAGVLNDATWEGVTTSKLHGLLTTQYTMVASAPNTYYAFFGGQALFQRNW